MTRWMKVVALSTLALLCTVAVVEAQEQTGAIEGTVTDKDGKALPGVTIEATGSAGTLVTTTDANGRYRLPRVTAGSYVVKSTLEGFVTGESQAIRVNLGQTAAVAFQLQASSVSETITVVGEATGIDVSSSSTSASISSEDIQYLPKGRDFTTIATQAAGATNEIFGGGLNIDGASGSENRYVIDGIDTTEPRAGTSGQNLVLDFVEEVQVKSAGYQAEYGGSVGGVINAVTKSGTNEFNGWVGAYYSDRDLEGDERTTPYRTSDTSLYRTFDEDDTTTIEPGFAIGGPIVKDKAWFYVGYVQTEIETNRTPPGQTTKTSTDTRDYYLANVKGNVGSQLLYKLSGNWAPREIDNTLPARDGSTAESTDLNIDTDIPTESYSGYADWIPASSFYMSARAGFYSTDIEQGGSTKPPYRILFGPTPFPIAGDPRYQAAGYFSVPNAANNGVAFDLFEREAASVEGNIFFTAAGSHSLKAGVQYEKVTNEVESGEIGNVFNFRWGLADRFGQGVIGTYGSVGVRRFGTFGGAESNNLGFFLQDSWSVLPNLTLNLGVRAEKEEVPNYSTAAAQGLAPKNAWEFDYSDKVAPRLGFAWDVMSDQKLKVYGSWGTYYDISKLNIRGSFGGEKWIEYLWGIESLDWETLPTVGNCTNSINDPTVNPCPGLGEPDLAYDLRHPSDPADPVFGVDPDLKPFEQTEIQLGADYQLSPTAVVGIRYVDKSVESAIEDLGFYGCNGPSDCFEGYNIGNPGKGTASVDPPGPIPSQPLAVRDYTAVELSWNRRFADNWQARIGYTWSELEGNYPGLASSDEFGRTSPNTNRLFDYLHNSFDDAGNPVFGPLNTDRTHQVDAQFVYRFGWGTSIGINQYYGYGTPISSRADYGGVPYFYNGREDSGRTDDLTQTDLSISHPFQIGDFTLEANLNVLNLFDEDTSILVDPALSDGDVCDSLSGDCGTQDFFWNTLVPFDTVALLDPALANPYFKKANVSDSFGGSPFQARRVVRVGLKFSF
ncbi:MAG TPA: carboxypeptidase regulatory-like domain-containing protein [Thermoanaerobaculia bacterium]|nr:carboxypeptidase regulatory-like domain-containing protein [Thermoanaerobaculia bacterium]